MAKEVRQKFMNDNIIIIIKTIKILLLFLFLFLNNSDDSSFFNEYKQINSLYQLIGSTTGDDVSMSAIFRIPSLIIMMQCKNYATNSTPTKTQKTSNNFNISNHNNSDLLMPPTNNIKKEQQHQQQQHQQHQKQQQQHHQ